MTNIDKLIKPAIQLYLKSVGFKKKGLQWSRDRGDFVDVVTIQLAKYNTIEKQTFTVNLGVFLKSFSEAVWQNPRCVFATEADCVVRVRLGDLMQGKLYGDSLDQWWDIEPSSLDGLVGTEIENALRELGIPFLGQFENYKEIADHLRKVKGWQTKNPLVTLYSALAEWKAGAPKAALVSLETIKGEVWQAKADVIRKLIESDVGGLDNQECVFTKILKAGFTDIHQGRRSGNHDR